MNGTYEPTDEECEWEDDEEEEQGEEKQQNPTMSETEAKPSVGESFV